MHLSRVLLEQFRCYERQELDIPPGGLRLAGSNASGKTSFIEGIRLLSMMKSNRAGVERELINWQSNQEYGLPPYARVLGDVAGAEDISTIEVSLAVDPARQTHTRKQIKIDGQPRRAIDAVGRLKTVLFEPEDMELVLGSPSIRRRYLDVVVSTLDPTYLRLLSQYNKILEQRNSLLKSLRDHPQSSRRSRMDELDYWDQELINRAAYLVAARLRFIQVMEVPLSVAFQALLGDSHELRIEYAGGVEGNTEARELASIGDLVEKQRVVAQRLERELGERRSEELGRGVTAAGPHRDDMKLLLDGRELNSFGSRGQQRLAVVAIKLAEIEAIRTVTGERAILLLDDVLSELDELRRSRLLERVGDLGSQVIVTATDARLVEIEQLEHIPLFSVHEGSIEPA